MTLVKFYTHIDGEVLAIFPQRKFDFHVYGPDVLTGYSEESNYHPVHKDYLPYITHPDKPFLDGPYRASEKTEFAGLLEKLTFLGYNLKVLNK